MKKTEINNSQRTTEIIECDLNFKSKRIRGQAGNMHSTTIMSSYFMGKYLEGRLVIGLSEGANKDYQGNVS